jgi:mono/diheme cytochrome c family protein
MRNHLLIGCLWMAMAALLTPAGGVAADKPPAKTTEPTGNAEHGRQLFEEYHCPLCHGHQAQGGGAFGPRLAPDVVTFDALRFYVRAPAGDMPPFTQKVLPERDLVDIYAYIRSQPTPPAVQSIAILNH